MDSKYKSNIIQEIIKPILNLGLAAGYSGSPTHIVFICYFALNEDSFESYLNFCADCWLLRLFNHSAHCTGPNRAGGPWGVLMVAWGPWASFGGPWGSMGGPQEAPGAPRGGPGGTENTNGFFRVSWGGPAAPLGWFWSSGVGLGTELAGGGVDISWASKVFSRSVFFVLFIYVYMQIVFWRL